MKPAAVINQGEQFVTLRATTDRPAEIREALAAREVQQVFKGDQNQAWDAVLANHCLARALGDSGAELTFFVHDERLGTSDARLGRSWRRQGRQYVLTEDYYRGRAGAVWEHQDVSFGLFFTETVSPEQFEQCGVHLQRAAVLWNRHAGAARQDAEWVEALSLLGTPLAGSPSDAATRLGPRVNAAELAELVDAHPEAGLYYAFTKTDGLYGLVPVENENVTLSSIPAAHPDMRRAWRWLLTRAAARGAMRMAASAAQQRGIKSRARRLAEWADHFLSEHPQAGVADFQAALGCWLTAEIFPADRLELHRTSDFTRVDAELETRIQDPGDTLHLFLDLALRYPSEFTEAYNEALNRLGFGLQRMKYDPSTGRYTPPFFVEFAPGGPGTPVYRYGIELSGTDRTSIALSNTTAGTVEVQAGRRVDSAADFIGALLVGLECPDRLAVVGKAAAFMAELQRSPRGLGLPRQGSKYAPMVDHLTGGLRARGILKQSTGLLIRIGLNALDRLAAMGDLPLRMPAFLADAMGERATCREVAARWRSVAAEAHARLELLSRISFGQHIHLLRLFCLNARGSNPDEAAKRDPRLRKLLSRLAASPHHRWTPQLGRELPAAALACIERLLARRGELLAQRARLVREAQAEQRGGRLVPPIPDELQNEWERIDCQLLLIYAACVRRLWQRAESLPYVNDRPYTLALYLLFGGDIFPPICRQVEFDVEYVSLLPIDSPAGREPAPVG